VGVISNNVPMMSLLQQYSDRARVGRVMSLNTIASMGLSPVSYAMVTALLSLEVSHRAIMPAFGLAMSAMMVVMTLRVPAIRSVD
jgi:DHA3 family macrolide efflux protein-like MFS transporter